MTRLYAPNSRFLETKKTPGRRGAVRGSLGGEGALKNRDSDSLKLILHIDTWPEII